MSVLLLRLAGPMQSWGTQSRFKVRDTGLEPSKSGVIGLLCAAMGRTRNEPVDDLVGLTMSVRVDREGRMARDFHTAMEVVRADGSDTQTVVSERYYLADADFLVGLEGDLALLARLHDALGAPFWPLYLGRKSFVPSWSIRCEDGLRPEGDLRSALETYPWRPWSRHDKPPQRLRLVLESAFGDGEPRNDVPVSLADRTFTLRYVKTEFCPTPMIAQTQEEEGHVPE